MREFPAKFTHKNLALFQQYKYERDVCYLREAVYEWFIREKPYSDSKELKVTQPFESPFDLEQFQRQRDPPNFAKMLEIVTNELKALGWLIKVGRENSALWIYPPNVFPPKSLPDW